MTASQFLRHRRRTVHHEVRVRDAARGCLLRGSIARMSPVGLRENLYAPWLVPIAIARASTPVRFRRSRAACFGVGEQLRRGRGLALGTDAVLLARFARLERAEAAQFAFDRHADFVRHLDDAARDVDVVSRKSAGVFMSASSEPSIITELEKPLIGSTAGTSAGVCTVILVQAHRNVRVGISTAASTIRRLRKGSPAYFRAPARGLQDRRAVAGFVGSAASWPALCSRLFTLNAGRP
jgi:hypothetical protein